MRGKPSPAFVANALLAVLLCLHLMAPLTARPAARQDEAAKPRALKAFTDDWGRTRQVRWPPRKIVVIGGSRSCVETVCALGKVDMIMARAEWSTWPPALAKVPHIGRHPHINLELLMRGKPDLVIATRQFRHHIDRIEALGLPVLVSEPRELEDVHKSILQMGLLLDCPDRAQELAAYVNRHLKLLDARLKGLNQEERPRVFLGRGPQVYHPSFSKGQRCVVECAGGRNIANQLHSRTQPVTPEWLAEQKPDFFVLTPRRKVWGFRVPTKKEMQSCWNQAFRRPGMNRLTQSQQAKVQLVDARLCYGLRSFIGALYLAKKFHPHLFTDIDPTAVHRDFLRRFFNLELQGAYVYP